MQTDASRQDRQILRAELLDARERFVAGPAFEPARRTLERRLVEILNQLEPECLGLYWPMRAEFNAAQACAGDPVLSTIEPALPFCRRSPRSMEFRAWDGRPPEQHDEWGIATAAGRPVVPDVVLVPCVGFTDEGHRLGYGAGFFDRWLAAHPAATAVGVAWSVGRIAPDRFRPEPHDQPLACIVTENAVFGG